MFNRKFYEAVEDLSDAIVLLNANIEELREEVDFLYHELGLDD
jgi:FtsZ-binding cell division protein ZapB